MVILRMKSFPKKLGKSKDRIDKELIKFLKEERIWKITYKEYKYLYTGMVFLELIKKYAGNIKNLKNYLYMWMYAGKEENSIEKGEKAMKFEEIVEKYMDEESRNKLIKAMREEAKGSVNERIKNTITKGELYSLLCLKMLNPHNIRKELIKIGLFATILDDIFDFLEDSKGLDKKEKKKALFIYLKEARKNFLIPRYDKNIYYQSFKVMLLFFAGAFQRDEEKLREVQIDYHKI